MSRRPTMMCASFLVALQFVLSILSSPVAADDLSWEGIIGSKWTYNYQDEWEGLLFNGTWEYRCVGYRNSSIDGSEVEAVIFTYELSTIVSGGPEYTSVSGGFEANGTEYYDPLTGDIIADLSDADMAMTAVLTGTTYSWNYHERNVTIYSPPGGNGTMPSGPSISPGTTWNVTYHKQSKSSGTSDGVPFSDEFDFIEVVNVTYLGVESITVPAGTFDCEKYRYNSSDGDSVDVWYSDQVKMEVRVVAVYPWDETIVYELRSYEPDAAPDDTLDLASLEFRLAFLAFIFATVAISAVAWVMMRNRRRPPASDGMGQLQGTNAVVDVPPPTDEPGQP